MLLVYKPFDVGDRVYIPGSGEEGFVREITLANTSFDHYTGKVVTIPNSTVWGSRIDNLVPTREARLMEFLFMISSKEDGLKIREVWLKIVDETPGIIKDDPNNRWIWDGPILSSSSGSLMYWCGAWAKYKEYWTVYVDILFKMWGDLNDAGITFGISKGESYVHLLNNQYAPKDHLSPLSRESVEAMLLAQAEAAGPEGRPQLDTDMDL
jgi:small conductance mechanosensitive channel